MLMYSSTIIIDSMHVDTIYGHGKWALIRKCNDNSRVATIKLGYMKLGAIIRGNMVAAVNTCE